MVHTYTQTPKSYCYCCVCGKTIEATSDARTGATDAFEEYICPEHSEKVFETYCNQEFIGFCSICGQSHSECCEHLTPLMKEYVTTHELPTFEDYQQTHHDELYAKDE